MSETNNISRFLLQEIRVLLTPLVAATQSGPVGNLLSEVTGWNMAGNPASNTQLLQLVDAYKGLDELVERQPRTILDVLHVVTRVSELIRLVDQIAVTPQAGTALGRNLFEALLIDYLATWHPLIYYSLVLVTAVQPPTRLALDRLPALLEDPIAVLRAEYLGPNGLVTPDDARTTAERLFPRLAAFLSHLGFEARSGGSPPNGPLPSSVASHVAGQTLSVLLQPNFQEPDRYAVTLALSPRDLGDFGLVVVPSGTVTSSWDADVDLTPAAGGFAIGPQGVTLFGASAAFSTRALAFDLSGLTIGSDEGTRLEIGSFKLSGLLGLATSDQEYGVMVDLGRSKLVVAAADDDGFLASFLPSDGLSATFDLAIGWTNKRGFFFEGSASLEVVIPVHKTLGPVAIKQVTLRFDADDGALRNVAGVSFDVSLGPIVVAIDRLGVRVDADFGADDKNLGVVDLDAGLAAPTGAGLRIDGGPVSGGGFLSHDPDRGRYAGTVTLSMLDLALGAYGVIDTKVPAGYSLLVAIQSRIPAIPLGLGFTLLGVGGLLGVNRTAALDIIREGLRDGGLAHVLYPEDPIRDLDAIIAETDRVFPIKAGRFLIGPTAKIGWGTPTLITADIGLVYDLPDPIRVALIGVVRCFLPDADKPLLRLQASFLGTIDLAKGQLAFDASLFDSKLLSFSLDGDMSARLQLGLIPNYLLTVGGFHPAYTPPPMGLPTLRRLTLNLLGGDNPRLRADLYFARTSNSFQLGAHVELYAAVSKFNVYGFVGFDALVQVRPTKFAAEVKATLAVRIGDDPFMSVGVEFLLEGPTPWHAKGRAHFKLCWFLSFTVSFDRTWGDVISVLAGVIDVLPLLGDALGDPNNWHAPLPAGAHALVTLRRSDDRLVDPGGTLMITQKLVPLDLTIDRFSSLKPQDGNRFSITGVTSENDTLATEPTADEFAPAEFLDMSDAERLSRPSFERFASGVRIASWERLVAGDAIGFDVDYERIILDKNAPARKIGRRGLDAVAFDGLVRASAISRSPLARNAAFAPRSPRVSLAEETYAVVSAVDLSETSARRELTYAEAVEELARVRRASPAAALQIVTTAEVA